MSLRPCLLFLYAGVCVLVQAHTTAACEEASFSPYSSGARYGCEWISLSWSPLDRHPGEAWPGHGIKVFSHTQVYTNQFSYRQTKKTPVH